MQDRMSQNPADAHPAIDPHAVETWIFDLDNTLYPAHCDLFAQVADRMGEFIARSFAISREEADRLRTDYFKRYGTTLRGLMTEHGWDPKEFLDYVHEIDLSVIPELSRLEQALERLPGRKVIFTNGTTRHAGRVTQHIGIEHHFDAVFDIVDSDYEPKPAPAPYEKMVKAFRIDPRTAVMVEDIARNLEPAAAMGMTTVWVPGNKPWSGDGHREPFVHHVVEDLAEWLFALAGER